MSNDTNSFPINRTSGIHTWNMCGWVKVLSSLNSCLLFQGAEASLVRDTISLQDLPCLSRFNIQFIQLWASFSHLQVYCKAYYTNIKDRYQFAKFKYLNFSSFFQTKKVEKTLHFSSIYHYIQLKARYFKALVLFRVWWACPIVIRTEKKFYSLFPLQ